MAHVDQNIVEMPDDESVALMPPYRRLIDWIQTEVAGLTDEQLDFDDLSPENEWMWGLPPMSVDMRRVVERVVDLFQNFIAYGPREADQTIGMLLAEKERFDAEGVAEDRRMMRPEVGGAPARLTTRDQTLGLNAPLVRLVQSVQKAAMRRIYWPKLSDQRLR